MNKPVVLLAAVILSTAALAQEPPGRNAAAAGAKAPLMLSFTDLEWTTLPEREGMQFAVLSGDPGRAVHAHAQSSGRNGQPAALARQRAHQRHHQRHLVHGDRRGSAKDFGPGSIVIMPANWVHVSGCRAASECVFYQEGKGKFDFKPVAAATPGR